MNVNQNAKALSVWAAINPHWGVFPQAIKPGFNVNQNEYMC